MRESPSRLEKTNIYKNLMKKLKLKFIVSKKRLKNRTTLKKLNSLLSQMRKLMKIMTTTIITKDIHQLTLKTTITSCIIKTTTTMDSMNSNQRINHILLPRTNLRLLPAQMTQICLLKIFWTGCQQPTNSLPKIALKLVLNL